MGCDTPFTTRISTTSGGAIHQRTVIRPGGSSYGRSTPQPHAASSGQFAKSGWPHLQFVERAVVLTELRNVWVSGNDGVVSDDACFVYLPSHGEQIPLHHNLPRELPAQRMEDGRIRHVGYRVTSGEGGETSRVGEQGDGWEEDPFVLISLTQIFAANFYSFLA